MKTIKPLLLSFIFLSMFTAASAQAKPASGDLSFFAGCWELNIKDGGMVISEHWMKPAGGTLIGMSRTVKGGKTIGFEFLRIVENADGIFYIARPSEAKEETSFKLVGSAKREAVFENLTHDFPQRLIYRWDKADSLFARVESGDKKKGMDIPMIRAKCE